MGITFISTYSLSCMNCMPSQLHARESLCALIKSFFMSRCNKEADLKTTPYMQKKIVKQIKTCNHEFLFRDEL